MNLTGGTVFQSYIAQALTLVVLVIIGGLLWQQKPAWMKFLGLVAFGAAVMWAVSNAMQLLTIVIIIAVAIYAALYALRRSAKQRSRQRHEQRR